MNKLLWYAFLLSLFTIIYNFIEGIISVWFGIENETLALLGFGVDSFVEVISGIGIVHFILRMRFSKVVKQDKFEKTALRITGFSFYLLTAGLLTASVFNLVTGSVPDTTFAGIVISIISLLTMYWLMTEKVKVGTKLNSDAVIADSKCTRTCFLLSTILLAASGLYEMFHIGYFDIIGSVAIAYFAFKEGKESLNKAESGELLCNFKG